MKYHLNIQKHDIHKIYNQKINHKVYTMINDSQKTYLINIK